MARYRYAKDSPKRVKWEGAHKTAVAIAKNEQWATGKKRNTKIRRLHQHPIGGATLRWQGITYTSKGKEVVLEAVGFLDGAEWNQGKGVGITGKAVSWFKAHCIEAKTLDRVYRGLDENGKRIPLPSTKRPRHRGSDKKVPTGSAGKRLSPRATD